MSLKGVTSKQAKRFIIAQIAVSVLLSVLLLFYSWVAAYSGLVGGMIATLATAWFAVKVFGVKLDQDPVNILRTLYLGEINKILITVSLFVAAFVLIRPVNAAALIAVYFFVYLTPFGIDVFFDDETYETEEKESK